MNFKPQLNEADIAHLKTAYQQAIYEVYYGKQPIRLRIGDDNPQLERLLKLKECGGKTWALITAFNPYSQPLSAAENQQRHQNLLNYLQPINFTIFEAVGKDDSGDWTPETSILIVGIDLIQAKELGNRFQQNAIVYGQSATPELIWLST